MPVHKIERKKFGRFFIYLFLTVMALLYLIPVYVMLITSLKPLEDVSLEAMWRFPSTISLEGYAKAWEKLAPHFWNSVALVVPATALSALLGSLNGYVFSKWRFRGSEGLFTAILFGMFIPYQSILIPLLQFLQKIGLYNSLPGLILVHIVYGIPITTLIFRNFYAGVPEALIEAARIDGAGFLRIYASIMIPLSTPGFVVVAVWQFTNIWNEFLFAVTITSPRTQPIMVALQNLSGSQIVQWNVQMAGALIAALPTLLVYILLSKYFIRGLLAGSVKG